MPSLGWITSPEPVKSRLCRASTTTSTASSRRSIRSVRQSLASSVAARGTLFGIILELPLEPLEQGKPVGRRAGEADQHLAVQQLADLDRVGLHDLGAERHLAVAADGHAVPLCVPRESSSHATSNRAPFADLVQPSPPFISLYFITTAARQLLARFFC